MTFLVEQLDSFDPAVRRDAVVRLADGSHGAPAERPAVNMHMHTFFSYNGDGRSPARLAWEARQSGLHAAAICDFDVLYGLDEFLDAGDRLGVRTAVGFESRTYFTEYAEQEINSPGEPGVFYFMGMGFVRPPTAGSPAAAVFGNMLAQAQRRNRAMIERINSRLPEVAIDHDHDVVPLTPAGNVTERHIVRAYHDKALIAHKGEAATAAAYWARALGLETAADSLAGGGTPRFHDLLRAKLMKKGAPGYIQPGRDSFPPLDDVVRMILECDAVPTSAWLDGTSAGEARPADMLECLVAKGVAALNIIPDRNWNLPDPSERERKIAELGRVINAAVALDLPLNVGTELNKPGQRAVDDFEAAPLRPYRDLFLDGARVMVGHTRLLRWAGYAYTGRAAAADFPQRRARNRFFAAVGALPCPDAKTREALDEAGTDKAMDMIRAAARHGVWALDER